MKILRCCTSQTGNYNQAWRHDTVQVELPTPFYYPGDLAIAS